MRILEGKGVTEYFRGLAAISNVEELVGPLKIKRDNEALYFWLKQFT